MEDGGCVAETEGIYVTDGYETADEESQGRKVNLEML